MNQDFMERIKTQSDQRMEAIRKANEERWQRWEGCFKPKTKADTSKGL